MSSEGYSGWNSYETWLVALWMDNDGSDEYWAEQAKDARNVGELSREIRDYHEEAISEATSGQGLPGFAQDMLNAAMREVSWLEIAERLWDDTHEDDEDDEDEEEDNG